MRARTLSLLLALSGCRSCHDAPVGSANGVRFRRCGALVSNNSETVSLGARSLTRDGYTLRDPSPATADFTVALMGGPHDASASDTRFARVGARLARVNLAVVVGGLSGTAATLRPWLDAVIPAHVPTLLVPADTEPYDGFRDAVATLRRDRPELLDATLVRHFLHASAEVVTLPGTHWPRLSRAGADGCAITDEDARALGAALPSARAPRIFVTASAPRSAGRFAIDRGVDGVHVGSDAVAEVIGSLGVRGVVSLLPRESAGTLSSLDGAELLGLAVHQRPFALSLGACATEPTETADGALIGTIAWIVHFRAGDLSIERVSVN